MTKTKPEKQDTKPPRKSEIVRQAFDMAKIAHKKQKRKTGEDYINHPLEVANILNELRMDDETIAAGILHDIVEDCDISKEDIEKKFGKTVAKLVQGVTKLDKISFEGDREEYSIENLRRMFLAMSEDIRVIMIKLADRLHNMRSLAYHTPEKQRRIAKETLEIFSPIADRLCMGEFKGTLEDLAFPYVYPEEYKWIKDHLTSAYADRHKFTRKMQRNIRREMLKNKIQILDVHGRAKHLYSLYRKLLRNDMDPTRIYDLVALRVVVKNVPECYKALGALHQKWKPLHGRIKDYIATPKPNGYQSIHTTLISNIGDEIVEVQIRTGAMHAQAEYGVAAHWYYQEQENRSERMQKNAWHWFSSLRGKNSGRGSFSSLPWIKEIESLEKEAKRPREFLRDLQTDILKDRIIVLTPQGHIRTLPADSTPIDFAYSIHTDVGNNCISAKINSETVPLNTKIKNGDVVKIITSRNSKGPKRQWLDFVVTSNAQAKIQAWFKKIDQAENIKYGKSTLEDTLLDKYDLSLKKVKTDLEKAKDVFKYERVEDIYSAIGRGEITSHQVLDIMFPDQHDKETGQLVVSPKKPLHIMKDGTKITTRIAECCHPKPGDPIIGVKQDQTIRTHLPSCQKLQKTPSTKRVAIQWAKERHKDSTIELHMENYPRRGMLRDIAGVLARQNISISEYITKENPESKRTIATLVIETERKKDLPEVLKSLRKILGVISVELATQNLYPK